MDFEYYLSLGSNMGDREGYLLSSIKLLSEIEGFHLLDVSNIYETDPVGYTDQDKFLNMVVKISSPAKPLELLQATQSIEEKLKRKRTIRFGPRTIDIDILLCKGVQMDSLDLTIPHPRMLDRAFVLIPLKDVFSDYDDMDIFEGQVLFHSEDKTGVILYKKFDLNMAFSMLGKLDINEIKNNLKTKILPKEIIYFDSIDSSNNYAKRIAKEGAEEGILVIANTQTLGRGRLGRQWDSNNNKGIWMSLVLRPKLIPQDAQIITLAASVAVVKTIESVVGIDARIKWPNDVVVDQKKVCGILTEAECESGNIRYVVLGIGVNANHEEEDFPEDLKAIATSLKILVNEKYKKSPKVGCNSLIKRETLVVELLYQLEYIYEKIISGDIKYILDEWSKRDAGLNDNELRKYFAKFGFPN